MMNDGSMNPNSMIRWKDGGCLSKEQEQQQQQRNHHRVRVGGRPAIVFSRASVEQNKVP